MAVTWNSLDGILPIPTSCQGDSIPDFSAVGCQEQRMTAALLAEQGELPSVRLQPSADGNADRTVDIRQALDQLAAMPIGAHGLRGVLQLAPGVYTIASEQGLVLRASGIVVRGMGTDAKTGEPLVRFRCTSQRAGATLFQIVGGTPPRDELNHRIEIREERVPVGAKQVSVASVGTLQVGDTIAVVRHGNAAWLNAIGMDRILPRPRAPPGATKNWTPFALSSHRIITTIDTQTNTISLDAPLTTAIEKRFGGGYIWKYDNTYRIQNVGVENILAECVLPDGVIWALRDGARVTEEDRHMEYLVTFDHAQHCWANNVVSVHFGFHSVVKAGAKFITIRNCAYRMPAAKLIGGKRYGFTFAGQLSLVENCFCEQARHAFAVDARTCGPNVFHQCKAVQNFGCSETHHRWGNGVLYDNVEAPIAIQDRQWMGSGQGWSGANCILWNCTGKMIVQCPPTAWNFAIGTQGKMLRDKSSFPKSNEDEGYIWVEAKQIPRSLFQHQRS